MAQGEDSNVEKEREVGVAEQQVVTEILKEETPSAPAVLELVTQADGILSVVNDESIGAALNETVDASSGEEVNEDILPDHVVPELVTQAAEIIAVETVESLMEADASETVDASSGAEVKEETLSAPVVSELVTLAGETVGNIMEPDISNSLGLETAGVEAVTEETDGSNRQSTFLTEIEDACETHMEERKDEKLGQVDQLENLIAESENAFHTEQIIGEIKGDVENIKEKEALPDMNTEDIDTINKENEEYKEKLIETELEEIAQTQTNVKEDEEENLVVSVDQLEKEEPKTFVLEEEQGKDNPELSIIEKLPEEPVGPIGEAETLIVDSNAEDEAIFDESHENNEILDEGMEELKHIAPIQEESAAEDTQEAEKIPILTIFMIAYVIFMALFVFSH